MTQNLPNKAFIMAELSAAAYQEPNVAKGIFQKYCSNLSKVFSEIILLKPLFLLLYQTEVALQFLCTYLHKYNNITYTAKKE